MKLPGPSQKDPNVYDFGTPYKQIYEELKQKDSALYTRNGLLNMLERNMSVKEAPQRWQDEKTYLLIFLSSFTVCLLLVVHARSKEPFLAWPSCWLK